MSSLRAHITPSDDDHEHFSTLRFVLPQRWATLQRDDTAVRVAFALRAQPLSVSGAVTSRAIGMHELRPCAPPSALQRQRKRAVENCAESRYGRVDVGVPLLKLPIALTWEHDCENEQTIFRLSGEATGWLGVGFLAQNNINWAFKMTSGDFYMFANDGTKAKVRLAICLFLIDD